MMTLIDEVVYALLFLLLPSTILAALSFTNPLASQLAPSHEDQSSISSAYPLEDAVGVRVPLGWSFSIGLQPDTCGGGSQEGRIRYSASGLPSWITFSTSDLTFSGETPEYYDQAQIDLSCKQGDEETSSTFLIQVQGQLQLSDLVLPALVTAPRNRVSYDMSHAISLLRIDQSQLNQSQAQDVVVATSTEYNWLSWNPVIRAIEGIPPDSYIGIPSAKTVSVPITFSLGYALPNTAPLGLTIEPYLLTADQYPPLHISRQLILPLGLGLMDPSTSLTIAFDPVMASEWITFDSSTATLFGTVPPNLDYSAVHVTMTATSPSTSLTATASFDVILEDRIGQPLLAKSTIALIVVMSLIGTLSTFFLGYFLFVRCSRPVGEPRGWRSNCTSEIGTPRLKYSSDGPTSITMRPNITGDTLVNSPDFQITPKAKSSKWWGFGGCDANYTTTRASTSHEQSKSRAGSISQETIIEPTSVPTAPDARHRSPRSRIHSSPGAIYTRGVNSQHGRDKDEPPHTNIGTWGPPTPRPPKGLSPHELKEWVDNYVCEWVAANGGGSGRGRRRYSRQGSGPSSTGTATDDQGRQKGFQQLEDFGALVGKEAQSKPHTSRTPNASPIITRLLDSCPYLSSRKPVATANVNATLEQSMVEAQHQHLRGNPLSIRRSTSYPGTINTMMTASSAGPSDISSVASWDSLDSWEIGRRQNYEEPRRRSDFLIRPPTNITRKGRDFSRDSSRRSQSIRVPPTTTSSRDGISIDCENASGSDEVPSIIVTAFRESKSVGNSVVSTAQAVVTPTVSSSAAASPHPLALGTHLETFSVSPPPESSLRDAAQNNTLPLTSPDEFSNPVEDEEEVVFFPRPIGAEVPGTGLARSPHLEGLSRFHGVTMQL
ncbi:hypothetical protein FRB94_003977 [Tulasnella sp. JGI-2019a]|nr:hypothetical protein FRB94_003977 [Tulasnella sp. JGI-2019a]